MNKGFLIRKKRVRVKVKGTASRPRLSVSRSNKNIFAQLIDDEKGITLIGISTRHIKGADKMKKMEIAEKLGEEIAAKAKLRKIKKVVFDKSGYKYHGRVKALADGARKGGLEF